MSGPKDFVLVTESGMLYFCFYYDKTNFDCRNRSRDYNIKNYTGALADFDKAIEINPRFAIA